MPQDCVAALQSVGFGLTTRGAPRHTIHGKKKLFLQSSELSGSVETS